MIKDEQAQYDPKTDVLYLIYNEGAIERSHEVLPGITLEYDDQGKIVGLEILHASKILTNKVIASLHAHQTGLL